MKKKKVKAIARKVVGTKIRKMKRRAKKKPEGEM